MKRCLHLYLMLYTKTSLDKLFLFCCLLSAHASPAQVVEVRIRLLVLVCLFACGVVLMLAPTCFLCSVLPVYVFCDLACVETFLCIYLYACVHVCMCVRHTHSLLVHKHRHRIRKASIEL